MPDTRQRLVTAAGECFRRRGFNGTALKHVTEAAGVPTGSLYHFFPGGKEELATAAVVESGDAYRRLFEAIADEAPDMAQAVANFFDGAAAVLEETDYIDPCPIGTVAREVASTNNTLRVATQQVLGSWIESAAARLEHAGVSPEHARALATTLVAALEGGFVLARAARDTTPLRTTGRTMSAIVEQTLAAPRAVPVRSR